MRYGPQGGIGITVLHLAGDIAEPRSKQERMHIAATLCQRMDKPQQHARVALHGSRYITDHDNRPRPEKILLANRQWQAALARHPPQRVFEGQAAMRGRGGKAARPPCRKGQKHRFNGALGLGHLVDTHHLEIGCLQTLDGRARHRHVDLDGVAVILFHIGWRDRVQRLVDTARCRVICRITIGLTGQGRQQQVPHLFHQTRVPPENVERLVEDKAVLGLFHKAAGQRVVEFAAVANINGLTGLDTVNRGGRPDPHAGTPQNPYEMGDVLVQLLATPWPRHLLAGGAEQGRYIVGVWGGHPALYPFISVWTSIRIRAASLPLMRAMSS